MGRVPSNLLLWGHRTGNILFEELIIRGPLSATHESTKLSSTKVLVVSPWPLLSPLLTSDSLSQGFRWGSSSSSSSSSPPPLWPPCSTCPSRGTPGSDLTGLWQLVDSSAPWPWWCWCFVDVHEASLVPGLGFRFGLSVGLRATTALAGVGFEKLGGGVGGGLAPSEPPLPPCPAKRKFFYFKHIFYSFVFRMYSIFSLIKTCLIFLIVVKG